MVKKYKLVKPENINKSKIQEGGMGFGYISHPGFTGLMPSGPYVSPINARVVAPSIPTPSIVTNSGITMGIPMVNSTSVPNMKVIIPPKIDPKDPSIFLATTPTSATGTKTLTANSDVRMTYKEPQPTQALFQLKPNLPYLPTNLPFNYPVGLTSGTPIIINPTESKAQLEFTSPDSDDIISITGEQDKVKPVYEAIEKNTKIKLAFKEVQEAQTELESVKNTSGADIKIKDTSGNVDIVIVQDSSHVDIDVIKKQSEEIINRVKITDNGGTEITDAAKFDKNKFKSAAIRYIKSRATLKDARSKTKLQTGTDDDDPNLGELIDLTKLFNKANVELELKKLKDNSAINFDPSGNIVIQEKKQDSVTQLLYGMPMGFNPGFGPIVSMNP